MKNNYIVLNPQRLILVKCRSIDKANEFIDDHLKRNTSNYQFLTGWTPTRNNYSIIDINAIPVYIESY